MLDLKEDITEISSSIDLCTKTNYWQDSIINYVSRNELRDSVPLFLSDSLMWLALPRISVGFNEVTAMQLKNAGNLRLIRKEEVSRKISLYWKQQENVNINIDRYLIYRNRAREFEEQLLELYHASFLLPGTGSSNGQKTKLLTNEPSKWSQYLNIIAHARVTAQQLKASLEKLLAQSKELVNLIEEKYQF